jgi:hypothetical protein
MAMLLDTLRNFNAERDNKIHVLFIHHELFIVFQIQVDLHMSVYKLESFIAHMQP